LEILTRILTVLYHEEMQVKFEYGCDPIVIEGVIALELKNFLKMNFRSFSH
jgi:hypothetical protein